MRQHRLSTSTPEIARTSDRRWSRARGLLTTIALGAISFGVYAAAPAAAAPAGLVAPERVYTGVNQQLAFTNAADPISGDTRSIIADIDVGAVCVNDPTDPGYNIDDCGRVQIDLATATKGLMFIPGLTVVHNNTLDVDLVKSPDDAIIDVLTGAHNVGSQVYHLSGTKQQINDTLETLVFDPALDFEDTADINAPLNMNILAINGSDSDNESRTIQIKIEGQNDAPTLTVPAVAVDAPINTEAQYPAVVDPGSPNDPANRLANAVDPEMCNMTFCGAPFQNPGGNESDDKMLLVAWLDPACGQFHLRGGAFTSVGSATNPTVAQLLTNFGSGLDLEPDQAAAVLSTFSPVAQSLNLQAQPSGVTTLTTAWAGIGGISEVRYALSQITYKSPMDPATCNLNVAVSDLGNNGMPATNGYVGSPIGGLSMPQPGYEIPVAKADQDVIVFNVKDTHPSVTVEQTTQGPGFDPTNDPAVFTAVFSEPVEGLTAANVTVTGSNGGGGTAAVSPAGPSDTYTITVTPTSDGDVTVSIPANQTHAAAGPSDASTFNKASTSTDNSVTFDTTDPTGSIALAPGQADPTSTSPIRFAVSFNEAVNPATFSASDIDLSTSTAGGALIAFVTPLTTQTFEISVAGMTTTGDVIASVKDNAIDDLAGNGNSASGAATVTWTGQADVDPPMVTINEESNQADPTSTSPVLFTVTFNEPVLGFDDNDVVLTGAGSMNASAAVSGGPSVFTVTVTGMTQSGPIVAAIPAGAATDGALNLNLASTSTDNTVTWAQPVPGVATHFAVTSAASTTAGNVLMVTVTALDFMDAPAPTYAGTVQITTTDGAATPPANAPLIAGVGTFAVTLETAGTATVTATDTVTATITGTTSTIAVSAGAATHFTVVAPGSATNGASFNVTVTALDQFDNTATGYAGLVHFTSTSAGTLPNNSALAGGTGVFPVTLTADGNQTVTATDSIDGAITGVSGTINVSPVPPEPATHFSVTTSASATAGTSITVTVTALDAANAATTGYAGTVHFTSSDGAATLPADAALVGGVGMFSVTLKTAGNQTITATDTALASITGTTTGVAVSAAAADHFTVVAQAAATIGLPITVVVTAEDQFGNTDTNYAGTVVITSTDVAADLMPASDTLTNGVGSFQVTLNTLGNQTITATDSGNNAITGTSGTTNVSNVPPAPATQFLVSAPASATAGDAFTVTVTALDAANGTASGYSGTVHFTSTSDGTLTGDVALVNGVGVLSMTLTTAGDQTITATDTLVASITGTSNTIAVTAAPAAQLVISDLTLVQVTTFNPTLRTAAEGGRQYNFMVDALDQFGNIDTGYSGIVHFTSDDPTAELPADSPLTNGSGMFTAVFHTLGTHSVSAADLGNPAITAATSAAVVVEADPVPTVPTTPTVPTLPTIPATTPTIPGTPSVPSGDALPATGTDTTSIIWLAALALLGGGTLVVLRARRRALPDS